ncbi:uncharacterized protein TNCT_628182 [Trichonephila clavata]|uniref:Uncharacterized protein n=1 Tax=Trichonephila clavata TaxID=2740835 RepID=A0A8X6M1Q8_TRICU|nr:uncharacterized protein TNCT_628182 [Trichonephila clavata]
MLLKIFIFLFAVCPTAWCQRGCSRDRMRQCEETLLRSIQRRINDMGRSDMAAHCMNVRDDFNCLLRETRCLTSETDRNRNGDTLRNALKYIRDGCDSAGASWRDSSCYVGDPMKNCESSYPLGGVQYASHNPETCRKYNLFYDCVMDTLRNRCRPDDERLLGQYLVDSAQDLAWNCGEQTSTSDWDRNNRDDRRYDSDRRHGDAAGDRYSDRERDGYNRGSGSNGYGRDRYDRYGASGRDTYNPSGGYGRNDYAGSSDITCCRNERCDRYRQQQCRDSLSRTIDNRMAGYQDSQKCRKTRDDFNCLMWQTSNCLNREERDRDNDIFRRARDFISRNCDTYGRWTENNCYKTTEMQRCEALVSNTRGGANYESCRGFLSFRDCMSDELMRRCTREDDLYQGAYLVDKAQEMSWQCGTTDQYNGRNQYSTFDRKYDQYDRPQDNYDNNNSPLHLEDEDAMCLSRAQSYTDQCKTNMEEKRRELYTENDFERRQRINCCSIREYRNCLFDATRRYCQTERSRVVDSLMAGYRHQLTSDSCVRVYDSECSAGLQSAASFVLLVTCLALLSALVSFRR